MKKRLPPQYWIGLGVVIVLSLGMFLYIFHQADVNKQNQRIENAADSIEGELSSYAYDKQVLPDSLAAAGIKKVPPTVTYKKMSWDSYMFCVIYKAGSLSPYQKGSNCHTSTVPLTPPPPFVKNPDGSYTVCGVKTTSFDTEGYIVPSTFTAPGAVDISNELFIFSASSKAFDEQCNPLSYTDLRVGDKVDAFAIVTSPNVTWPNTPTPMISIFLKRS